MPKDNWDKLSTIGQLVNILLLGTIGLLNQDWRGQYFRLL